MSAQLLLLDRVEFSTIKIEAAKGEKFEMEGGFPQLKFDFEKTVFLTRSTLSYPEEEAADPRHFALQYGIKVEEDAQKGVRAPYFIEVEAIGYLRYTGGEEFQGEDRFRAVRFSGYQILYGSIREMVCNLTARGRHGMWQLPARHFQGVAKTRATEDERQRLEFLKSKGVEVKDSPPAIEVKPVPKKRASRKKEVK
ncbi:hypothetical protein [Variovorax paradoxus]|uniref:hypothetical protein n=1 Tax=Variovorax paradoxus TaxID=34073 RepID=UPI001ABC844A